MKDYNKALLMKRYSIDEYEQNLHEQKKGTHTIQAYVRNAVYLFEWIKGNYGQVEIDKITFSDLCNYKTFLIEDKKAKSSTVNLAIHAIRNLFNFYCNKGYIEMNIANGLTMEKQLISSKQDMIPDDVFKNFHTTVQESMYKHHIVISELLRIGLRVSEICNIKLADLQLQEIPPSIRIVGSNQANRTLPLNHNLLSAIEDYLLVRKNIPTSSDAFILSERKKAYNRSGIYKIVRGYSTMIQATDRNGNKINLSPHLFRQNAAYRLLAKNDPVTVASILGMSSVQFLLNHYKATSNARIKKAIDTL